VLDGNVIRVLARLTAETGEVTSTATRARLQDAAQRFLSPRTPADHNQAVMELGATICLPRDPKCSSCPLSADCGARKSGMERELPVKGRKAGIRRVGRKLLVAIEDGRILLWQRHRDAARLGGFWELPEPESPPEAPAGEPLYRFQHAITNHIYEFHVYAAPHSQPRPPWVWVPLADLPAIPLSTVARKALRGAGHSV
jgi:A/G-specific adenine glycosylase